MCGRYAITLPPEAVRRWFGTGNVPPNFPPRWNAAPTLDLPVVRFNRSTGERSLDLLRWGLVPSFAKDPKAGAMMINARAETIATKPSFRSAFHKRRCLVPIDAFYEWRTVDGRKQAYAVGLESGDPMALAGLWEGWRDPANGEWLRTFTIVTTAANQVLAPLHERMPVILRPADFPAWLGELDAGPDDLLALLAPYPSEETRVWPVSDRVNSVRNDGPDLLEPMPAEEESGHQGSG